MLVIISQFNEFQLFFNQFVLPNSKEAKTGPSRTSGTTKNPLDCENALWAIYSHYRSRLWQNRINQVANFRKRGFV